ncbi:VOC family protein [Streptomyces sp. SID3343]|nr:VOC family protein [Streptomyces sp. SID3343]
MSLGCVVFTTTDLDRAIGFWTHALGLRPRDPVTDGTEFVVLQDADTRRDVISLQLGEISTPAEPVRVHVDLYTRDRAGEVARLLALGATAPAWTYPEDAVFVVLADPDGHPFCVVEHDL